MSLNNVKVVKKDGTKEEFNVQKVVVAVNKSAYRALIKFSQKDIDFICHFVEEKVEELGMHEIQIPEMHNIVEGAAKYISHFAENGTKQAFPMRLMVRRQFHN